MVVSIQLFDDGSCTMFKLELGSCMKRGNFLSNVDSKSPCQRYFLEPCRPGDLWPCGLSCFMDTISWQNPCFEDNNHRK